jgi:hypothetical protein
MFSAACPEERPVFRVDLLRIFRAVLRSNSIERRLNNTYLNSRFCPAIRM